jgi:hypothetical protein
MLEVVNICDARRPAKTQGPDLYPYLAELLADAPQVVLDYLAEDLAEYERAGFASKTMLRLLERARCLADADRIEMKFAA